MLFKDINANIRLQILSDLNYGINPYEIKAKATDMVLKDDLGMTESEARKLVNAWYECLTYTDVPAYA